MARPPRFDAELPHVGSCQAAGIITWQSGTSDPRALESPDQSTRIASAAYDPNQIIISMTFNSAFNGNLEFYVLDWDSQGRRETISVNGVQANLSSDFSQGAWVSFPVKVDPGAKHHLHDHPNRRA